MLWDPFMPLASQLGRSAAFLPPVDVTVSEGDMVLTMDVPGLRSEDISIEFVDGHLVVRGERRRPETAKDVSWAHAERAFGAFERRIRVPEGVDPDRVTASLDNGVLSLIVPKPERLRPRTIQVSAGDEQRRLEPTPA